LSPRVLFANRPGAFFEAMRFVTCELRGVMPVYAMHTDLNDAELLREFCPDGWIRFYRRVASLLEKQAEVKGIFGTSWFFDPKLESISPHLTYLRTIVTNNGGAVFYGGSSCQAVKDATLKSRTRRRLYEEKKYLPASYTVIWPRRKLISWAKWCESEMQKADTQRKRIS
jgi:hypothetical protein